MSKIKYEIRTEISRFENNRLISTNYDYKTYETDDLPQLLERVEQRAKLKTQKLNEINKQYFHMISGIQVKRLN